MKGALFLPVFQHILFFSLKTNCNDFNLDCFYAFAVFTSKPFGGLVNV